MKRKFKASLAFLLLAFAGMTLAVQVAKEFRTVEPMQLAEGLNVVCTHATQRCPTCVAVESLTRHTLDESYRDAVAAGHIVFRTVNYEKPEIAAFAGEFKVATATVVLVNVQNGKVIAGKNLVNESWRLYTDEPEFKKMLKTQIDAMLQGVTLEPDDKWHEIIFDDDDDDFELSL